MPLDDRSSERFEQSTAGRPTLIRGNSQLFFSGMGRLSENSVVSIKNKSFSVTAEVDVPDGGANGGDHRPGRPVRRLDSVLQRRQRQVRLHTLGIQEFPTAADTPIPGRHPQVRMEFAYDGGGLAKGGDVTLYYDGQPVGTGRVENTQPMIFSSGERDGGREPTATSGPVSTPATSYAWVSSESATIASSERPHRARR